MNSLEPNNLILYVNPGSGNTYLHYAASLDDRQEAEEAVIKLFNSEQYKALGKGEAGRLGQINFINQPNNQNETALQLATSRRNQRLVTRLIKEGADIYKLQKQSDTDAVKMIYDKALIEVFNSAIEIKKGKTDPENVSVWEIVCDFKNITGLHNPRTDETAHGKILNQTLHLARVLRRDTASRSAILQHPLVQIFLHLKQKKYNKLLYCSMLYHILWSLISFAFILCNTHILESTNIPGTSRDSNLTELCAPFSIYEPGTLNFNANFYFFAMIILFLFTVAIEIVEQYTCPDKWYYYKQLENLGQIVVLFTILVVWVVALITGFENKDENGEGSLEKISMLWINWIPGIYIAGLFASLLLIQGQLTKFRFLGIYNEMFATGFLNIIRFLLAFLPLLVAFLITFHLLLPMRQEFLPSWGLGFAKLLAMMTGELGHSDIFYAEDEKEIAFRSILKLLFIAFIVTVVILLQNLLIGVTVSDVQALLKKAKVNNLASMLEDIYLMENVVTSPLVAIFCKWIIGAERHKKSLTVYESDAQIDINNGTGQQTNQIMKGNDFPEEILNYFGARREMRGSSFEGPRFKRLCDYPEEIREALKQWDKEKNERKENERKEKMELEGFNKKSIST